ncbi:MAG: pyridoxamine 5'-phosphate oxidase family protein [Myxococcota bacterium]|jgi:nitroimidazol reductase NimA-like FMN-containing flavoprotein (pyridoxamine 5'-phosphate oxidase superfamily)|nr:pyridoxamine 5'-phosphate oxidase family protein [Myxococcota bacterium]
MSLAMTKDEREKFLAALHVGVISMEDPGRGPLTVPIWYMYEPGGELWVITDRDSRKGKLLKAGKRISLVAQTETAPYQYVSVEGPIVTVEPSHRDRDTLPMAQRYLGEELGRQYVAATSDEREARGSIVVRMRPERWLTVDYKKRFTA